MSSGRPKLEIILTGQPSAVQALAGAFTMRSWQVDRIASLPSSEIFYDTINHDVTSAGLILSSKQIGDECSQVVRFNRRLSSDDIVTPLPAGILPAAPTGDAACDGLLSLFDEELAPFVRLNELCDFRRLSKSASFIEARIIDIRATALRGARAGAVKKLAEIRLSLLYGEEARLFEVARLLTEEGAGTVRMGLGAGVDPARIFTPQRPPAAANRIEINPDADAASVLGAGLRFCAKRMALLIPIVADQHSPEAGRQMRVVLRRFRSMEQLFRGSLNDGGRLCALSAQAREFAHVIGEARDWDVFVSQTLANAADNESTQGDFLSIKSVAQRLRRAAWARASRIIGSERFTLFVLDLMQQAETAPWRDNARKRLFAPARVFAERALDKRLHAASKVAVDLVDKPPSAGHELRLALKKLRYNAQLFRDVYPREARKPYMQAMSELQDAFGVLNDAVVAQSLADRAALGQGADAARAAGFISGYHAAQAEAASLTIAQKWDDFAALEPFWR